MADEWQEYVKDPRTVCKYGSKCYQKNQDHQQKFKHPPLKKRWETKAKQKRFSPYTKKEAPSQSKPSVTAPPPVDSSICIQEESKHEKLSLPMPDNLEYHNKDIKHEMFKELFLVDMPSDFFLFYECLNKDDNFRKTLASVNLEPIGPFDLLLGELPVLENKDLYLIHWRFFFDPPEFQAVLKRKGTSEYHLGYYRDDPEGDVVFVASNDSTKGCSITPTAENVFGAVFSYLQNEKKHSPFTAISCQKLMDKMKEYAEEKQISLDPFDMKKRSSQIVTRTLHGSGIVVPYNKKTQLGYRRLVETDANLRKLFTNLENATTGAEKDKILSELQPVITYASIAVDECDFGTGLEVGLDLFCSGLKELEASALSSLSSAYTLLKRTAFLKVIEVHLKYRRRGPKVSVMDLFSK